MARKRLRALRYPKAIVDDVAQLVFLHLRFHGYGTGEWTDSAVRRYVTDAGPLLARLHTLVRSDCTTRNRRARGGAAAQLRLARGSGSPSCAAGGARRGSGPTSTATRSWGSSACRRGRWWARRTSTCWTCGWSAGRWGTTRPRPSCGGGRRRTGSARVQRLQQVTLLQSDAAPLRASSGSGRGAGGVVGEQAEQVEPTARGEQPRRAAVRRAHHRGDGDRYHVADVEHRVVEGEHPAAGLVADLALHGGVGAELDDLARRARARTPRRAPRAREQRRRARTGRPPRAAARAARCARGRSGGPAAASARPRSRARRRPSANASPRPANPARSGRRR